ncbi:ankyrin repeat and protein kinase domain-containing protein 1 [Aplochiton taeniatus]
MDCFDGGSGKCRNFRKDDFEADWIKVSGHGFGQVYRVKLKLWREQCALKTFDCSLPEDGSNRGLLEGVTKMAEVRFKYIASVYGVCAKPAAVVMEYMSNGSLNNLLASHALMWPKKFQMIHEIATGMNFLHSMEPPLLHLNLKTSNVLLDDHLHVKISDFGLIKRDEEDEEEGSQRGLNQKGLMELLTARGNISYIPPETFKHQTAPPRTSFDVYSFSIVMWETLTQQKPYPGCNVTTVIMKASSGKRPSVERIPDHRAIAPPEMPDLPTEGDCGTDALLSFLSKKDFVSFRSSVREEHMATSFHDNNKLLHYTVESGDVASVLHILTLGAEVNSTSRRGYTPLVIATQKRLHDIIALLLKHGADVGRGDGDRWTALHFAAQGGDARATRLLLDGGALPDARETAGWTPLHLACQNDHRDVARLLLARVSAETAALGWREEAGGRAPLHMACSYGHHDLVKLLLARGADPHAPDRRLSTPLHLAAEAGHNRVARQLVRAGAEVNREDEGGCTPLHLAALRGHAGICRQLLGNGARLDPPTRQGWTPLHLAALRGHVAALLQLESQGCSVNARGQAGWTPLHLACHHGRDEAVERLLASKADPGRVEDSAGWTPLHLASGAGCLPSVLQLISRGARVNAASRSLATPLHLAAQRGCAPVVNALLRSGADRRLLDDSGSSALDLARKSQKEEVVKLLTLEEEYEELG